MGISWTSTYGRALVAEKSGKNELAIRLLNSLISQASDEQKQDLHYRLAHLHLKEGHYTLAATNLASSLAGNPNDAHRQFRFGTTLQRLERWEQAANAFEKSLSIDPSNADASYRLGLCKEKLGLNLDSIAAFRNAVALDSSKKYHHDALLRLTRRTGQLQMVNEVLHAASKQFPEEIEYKKQLADSYVALADPINVDRYFTQINKTSEATSMSCFRHGVALEELGKKRNADILFNRAIELEKDETKRILGIGYFYEKTADYLAAAEKYRESALLAPSIAELHFREGLAHERTYFWESAVHSYELALTLAPHNASWFYRLGLVNERLERWENAAQAYEMANERSQSKNSYWTYRHAYVLNNAGSFKKSIAIYAHSFGMNADWEMFSDEKDKLITNTEIKKADPIIANELIWPASRRQSILELQDAHACYLAGLTFNEMKDYQSAAELFSEACYRNNSFNPEYYAQLGRAYAHLEEYELAAKAFREVRIIKMPHGVDSKKYTNTISKTRNVHYIEYRETLPLLENFILFESGGGSFTGCNPLAIFKNLESDAQYSKFRFVWVVNKKNNAHRMLRGNSRVILIEKESDAYLRYLASAKYLINNNTFPPYFSRRPGQRYLNTWHGIPLKTLGKDIKTGVMDHKNAARNLLHATHIISPNRHFTDVLMLRNDIDGLVTAKVAEIGYPRVDQIINSSKSTTSAIKARLGIPDTARVALYAPTWRGDLANKYVDLDQIKSDLEAMRSSGYRVLFKGHPMVESELLNSELADILVDSSIDTNELLGCVDVLITDYSSIMFDFMVTGKPILYYAYDLEDYKQNRGLYFDLDSLPGAVCTSISDLVESLTQIRENEHSVEKTVLSDELCALEDGAATERAVKFFLDGDETYVVQRDSLRKNILFFQGSFIPNGISSAFNALVKSLNKDIYRPVVVLEPGALHLNQNRLDVFNSIKSEFQTIGRVGNMAANLEQLWIIDRMNARHELEHDRMWAAYHAAFRTEFVRMFGSAQFETVICFEGYAKFWAALLANSPTPGNNRTIYLHNDMVREYQKRFKYLKGMFALYAKYDRLVSVSKSVGNINKSELSGKYSLSPEKFVSIDNQIDPTSILVKSEKPLDKDVNSWMSRFEHTFVNVARLSPEKGQEKLLESFARIKSSTDIKIGLIIVGEGPLEQQLKTKARDLGISDSVLFTGLRSNPYNILAKSDTFVFSSNYEGQGLVVLEALVLGTPVLSTDVVGPQSILEGGEGLLVDNNVSALATGMKQMVEGNYSLTPFDVAGYNLNAAENFRVKILERKE